MRLGLHELGDDGFLDLVEGGQRLVAFLYADRLGAPMNEDDYRSLEIASSALGSSLARLLMDLRRAIPN